MQKNMVYELCSLGIRKTGWKYQSWTSVILENSLIKNRVAFSLCHRGLTCRKGEWSCPLRNISPLRWLLGAGLNCWLKMWSLLDTDIAWASGEITQRTSPDTKDQFGHSFCFSQLWQITWTRLMQNKVHLYLTFLGPGGEWKKWTDPFTAVWAAKIARLEGLAEICKSWPIQLSVLSHFQLHLILISVRSTLVITPKQICFFSLA